MNQQNYTRIDEDPFANSSGPIEVSDDDYRSKRDFTHVTLIEKEANYYGTTSRRQKTP